MFKNKRATKLEAKIVVTKEKDMNPDLEDVKPKPKPKGKKKKVKKVDGAKGLKTEVSMESLAEGNSVDEGGSPTRTKPKKKKKTTSPLKKNDKGETSDELNQSSSAILKKQASPNSQSQPKIAIPIPMPILTQDSGISDEASNEEEPPTPLMEFKDIEGHASKREFNVSPLSVLSDDEAGDARGKGKRQHTVKSSLKSKHKKDPNSTSNAMVTMTDGATTSGMKKMRATE